MFLSLRSRQIPIPLLHVASRFIAAFESQDGEVGLLEKNCQAEEKEKPRDTNVPIVDGLSSLDQSHPTSPSQARGSVESSGSGSSENGQTDDLSRVDYQGGVTEQTCSETKAPPRKKSLSLPTVHLPAELQSALDNAMSSHPRWSLVQDGKALSHFLVARKNKKKHERSRIMSDSLWDGEDKKPKKSSTETTLRYGRRESMAYASSRIQASYGTVKRVLSEIASREPSFKPETVLDFGSGLGTVSWATHQLWGDSVYEHQCVDISQWMGEMAKALRSGGELQEGGEPPIRSLTECIPDVYFKQYLPVSNKVQYDLVVAAHTLGDLPNPKLRRLSLASLWRKTKQFLVLIELGNWTGFENITESREFILEAPTKWMRYEDEGDEQLEGHVFAPCPHDQVCPLASDSKKPCHFAQRVQLALSEKDGPLRRKGYHQENFSYVVFKKGKRQSQSTVARLLQPVRKRTRHIICDLCTPDGEAKQVILTKSKHRSVYKEGRQSEWGDTLPASRPPTSDRSSERDNESKASSSVDGHTDIT